MEVNTTPNTQGTTTPSGTPADKTQGESATTQTPQDVADKEPVAPKKTELQLKDELLDKNIKLIAEELAVMRKQDELNALKKERDKLMEVKDSTITSKDLLEMLEKMKSPVQTEQDVRQRTYQTLMCERIGKIMNNSNPSKRFSLDEIIEARRECSYQAQYKPDSYNIKPLTRNFNK